MLTIAKLAAGGEDYYLSTVAPTVEDYYTGEGEAPGRWIGRGREALDLSGVVAPVALRHALGARSPDGEPLLAQNQRKVPGFDLTFRAPKSVSLLWALSDEEVSAKVRRAHDRAVAASLDYLERNAARTRRGRGGAERVAVDGLVAAAFRHRTSRADDPLLHTHVLVANVGRTSDDGVWRTLDGRQLYLHAKTAGYLYQSHLRDELTRELGVDWQPVTNGYADIAGVPRDVIEAFSRRRAQILEHLEEVGHDSAAAAQVATLATRPAKSHAPVDELRERWRERSQEHGFGPRQVARLLGRATPEVAEPSRLRPLAERLLSPDGLTAHASTFGRREAIQGWCEELRLGSSILDVERYADRLLSPSFGGVLRLTGAAGPARTVATSEGIRLADGRLVRSAPDEPRYTTPELLALEQRLVDRATARLDDGVAGVDPGVVARVIGQRSTLRDEQADAARRLTTSGAGVEVLVGRAGTGKTYTLGIAREAWEEQGIPVVGCALAARAALELQTGSGIRSATIARLLGDLDDWGSGLPPGGVLVIDEAAMVGTRTLARLLDEAGRSTTKVVLVGDHHQLPEIDAGGAFRGLTYRLPSIELVENHRQQEGWQRDALAALRHGEPADAVGAYDDHGELVVGRTADETREQLVGDWWHAVAEHGTEAVMVAASLRDIDDLNARARVLLDEAGALRGRPLEAAGREYRVGDRILCLRNHGRLGVLNGTRGTVTDVDRDARALTFARDDTGEQIELPADYLDAGWVDHGYALTAHKAQGLTCEATFVLGSDQIYREWGYVALSRGRQTNRLYLVGEPEPEPDDPTHPEALQPEDRTPAEVLAAHLQRSHQQALALDHGAPVSAASAPSGQPAVPDGPVAMTGWLERAIGPCPDDPEGARVWRQAVTEVDDFRQRHGIADDDDRPLGTPPDDQAGREAYQQALRQLIEARRQLAPAGSDDRALTPERGLELA